MKKLERPFWILWNPQGANPPTYRFSSFESAANRAEEMQKNIGTGTMFILKVQGAVTYEMKRKWTGFRA